MNHYYTATPHHSHDLELGNTELHGPFSTPETRLADIEAKRQEDHWNLEEDTISIFLLDSEAPITGDVLKVAAPAPAFDEYDDDDYYDDDEEEDDVYDDGDDD